MAAVEEVDKMAEQIRRDLERVRNEIAAWSQLKRDNADALMFPREHSIHGPACSSVAKVKPSRQAELPR